ncbi:MAG TPA: cytochrome c biogenesis protein CcdA [Burkholderiales bacterium]|jgi:cytochrome c-type biogenesis protein|nr:cytochrome c biogenesis protein CcdA [Burkholderiales bacterium]
MTDALTTGVLLPIGLGLLGFIEPCTIGSTLVFIKVMEGKPAATKLWQVGIFTASRAIFIGMLGAVAVLVGAAFIGFQKAMWTGLGTVYFVLGLLFLAGRTGWFMRSLGPSLASIGDVRSSAALGMIFGLNIPACSAPLLFALLGAAAASGVSGATLASGFSSLALFGLALSLPLAMAVLFAPARRALDWLAGLSGRIPRWTGIVLMALGVWSIWFGLYVTPQPAI